MEERVRAHRDKRPAGFSLAEGRKVERTGRALDMDGHSAGEARLPATPPVCTAGCSPVAFTGTGMKST